MKRYNYLIFITILLITNTIYSQKKLKVYDIMKKMEEVTDLRGDVTAKVSIVQRKVGQGDKMYEYLYYRRDRDDAFLVVTLSPESEKGNGYLRVEDNFWMYRVNTRTFQHINRDENISGTDVKAGDLERRKFTELYQPATNSNGEEILSEEMLGKIPVYRFEVVAKVNDVTYPKAIFWVRKDNFLQLKSQSFSLSGTLMQTAYYLKYTLVQDKYIWVNAMFVDEFEKGNKTIAEIQQISVTKIDDKVFTKAYLENLSK